MEKNNKNLIIGFALLLFLLLGFLFLRSMNDPAIDTTPEGYSVSEDQVALTNGDALVELLASVDSVNWLSRDLYVFAKSAYKEYADEGSIGFKINSAKQEGDEIIIRGVYGSSNNEIAVEVKKLKKGRISTSIVDMQTKLSFNPFLPSNTKENQFIGTLPIEKTEYVIDYLEDSKTYTVNVFNKSSNYELAEEEIKQGLGIDSVSGITILRYGAGDVQFDNRF